MTYKVETMRTASQCFNNNPQPTYYTIHIRNEFHHSPQIDYGANVQRTCQAGDRGSHQSVPTQKYHSHIRRLAAAAAAAAAWNETKERASTHGLLKYSGKVLYPAVERVMPHNDHLLSSIPGLLENISQPGQFSGGMHEHR